MEELRSCAPLPNQTEFGHVLSSEIDRGNKQLAELLLNEANQSDALTGGCGAAYGVWHGLSATARDKVKKVQDANGEHLEFNSPF